VTPVDAAPVERALFVESGRNEFGFDHPTKARLLNTRKVEHFIGGTPCWMGGLGV
jgi:hypothetical protein